MTMWTDAIDEHRVDVLHVMHEGHDDMLVASLYYMGLPVMPWEPRTQAPRFNERQLYFSAADKAWLAEQKAARPRRRR